MAFLPYPSFHMSKNRDGLIVIPGDNMREPDRMTIAETAEAQFIEYYNNRNIPIPEIKEAIRRWNAGLDPKNLIQATLYEKFRELQRKVGL